MNLIVARSLASWCVVLLFLLAATTPNQFRFAWRTLFHYVYNIMSSAVYLLNIFIYRSYLLATRYLLLVTHYLRADRYDYLK